MNPAERKSIITDLEHYAHQLGDWHHGRPIGHDVRNWTTVSLLRKRLLRIAELVRLEGEQQAAAETNCPTCVDVIERLYNTRRVLWTAARGCYPQPLRVPRVAVPQSEFPELQSMRDQATGDLLLLAALEGETDHMTAAPAAEGAPRVLLTDVR